MDAHGPARGPGIAELASQETDPFYPALYRGTRAVPVPDTPENGYHLTRDLANDRIDWMGRQNAIAPDRPLFASFSTGAAHAPHQPPLDWRGRNAGRFDLGWDQYREQTWRRQLELASSRPGPSPRHGRPRSRPGTTTPTSSSGSWPARPRTTPTSWNTPTSRSAA
jgi:arylsulfatase A-like enzyme